MALQMTIQEADEILRTWQSLNARIMQLNLVEAEFLLKREQEHLRRLKVMVRLYSRFSKLRSSAEKATLGQLSRG